MLAAASLLAALVAGCSTSSTTSEDTSAAESTAESSEATSSASATAGATEAPAADTPLPDGPQIISESARTTETLRSVHLLLAAVDLPELPIESVDADVTNEPQGQGQAVGNASFRPAQDEPYVSTDFLVVDKTMYTKAPDGSYVSVGPAEQIYDPGVILDRERGIAKVIASIQNPVAEGREEIDGIAVVKVTGTIDPAIVDPIVPRLGADVTEPLPVTVWIADVAPPAEGQETTIPSEDASPGAGPNLVRINIVKGAGNVDVTLSNWAEPVTIPTP